MHSAYHLFDATAVNSIIPERPGGAPRWTERGYQREFKPLQRGGVRAVGDKSLAAHTAGLDCVGLLMGLPRFHMAIGAVLCWSIRVKSVECGVAPLYIDQSI